MTGEAIIATLILGAMCLTMWFLARMARKRMGVGAGTVSNAGLRVVGKRPLDQKSSLFVVEIAGGRHILVGSSIEGGVSKLDDISPEEFAVMTADDPKLLAAKPRLRLANRDSESSVDTQEQSLDDDEAPHLSDEARFATVSESFSNLLGKAREARTTRKDRRASGE